MHESGFSVVILDVHIRSIAEQKIKLVLGMTIHQKSHAGNILSFIDLNPVSQQYFRRFEI